MSIKIIEIILFIITLFLLWICCYPDYVVVWGKGIAKLIKRGGKGQLKVLEKGKNNIEEK